MRQVLYAVALVLLLVAFGAYAQPAAQDDSEDRFTVTCPDQRQIVGLRLTLTNLNPEGEYRITLLGGADFDPALAIIRTGGAITCSDNEGNTIGTQIAVPGGGRLMANEFATQYAFFTAGDTGVELVIGGFVGSSGPFSVAIEGYAIDPADETEVVRIEIPPSHDREWFGLFVIGQGDLDPRLTLTQQQDDGSFLTIFECDNAGTGACQDVPVLRDNGAIVNESTQYVGDALDAGYIGVPGTGVFEALIGASRGASVGSYALIMNGIAPGDSTSSAVICDNVAATIAGASASYNALYPPENVLDGDPNTVWVSGSVTAAGEAQRVFMVIGLEEPRTVTSVRINGFVLQTELRGNSLQTFDVVVTDMNNSVVTALTAEAQLRPGYQRFPFRPAQVREVGLIFKENYNGSLFEIADVQICAEPLPPSVDEEPEPTTEPEQDEDETEATDAPDEADQEDGESESGDNGATPTEVPPLFESEAVG